MLYPIILFIFLLFFVKFAVAKANDPLHPSRREHPCKAMFMELNKV